MADTTFVKSTTNSSARKHLKTMKSIILKTSVLAMAVVGFSFSTRAAEPMKPMKGGEHQMMLHTMKTEAEAKALKPGDSVAMVCAKCKSVVIEKVNTEKGHIKLMTPGDKHLCAGCNSTVTVVGVGKGAKDEIKHTCEKCGSDSAFCCATKPGAGATEGMEK